MANQFNGLDKAIMDRPRNDFDSVVGISGDEGTGKSTLSIQLGLACDPAFGVEEKHILFQPSVEQMKQAISGLPRYSVIDADEAIRILWKHRRFEKLQLYLTELYAIARKFNQITLLNIPRFRDFSEPFRQHRIKIWIHCIKRGTAAVFFRSDNFIVVDPWFIKDAEKRWLSVLKGRRLSDFSDEDIDNSLRRIMPETYWGIIHWDDIDREQKKVYTALKEKYAHMEFEGGEAEGNIWKVRTCRLTALYQLIGLKNREIAELIKEDEDNVSVWGPNAIPWVATVDYNTVINTIEKAILRKKHRLGNLSAER